MGAEFIDWAISILKDHGSLGLVVAVLAWECRERGNELKRVRGENQELWDRLLKQAETVVPLTQKLTEICPQMVELFLIFKDRDKRGD